MMIRKHIVNEGEAVLGKVLSGVQTMQWRPYIGNGNGKEDEQREEGDEECGRR